MKPRFLPDRTFSFGNTLYVLTEYEDIHDRIGTELVIEEDHEPSTRTMYSFPGRVVSINITPGYLKKTNRDLDNFYLSISLVLQKEDDPPEALSLRVLYLRYHPATSDGRKGGLHTTEFSKDFLLEKPEHPKTYWLNTTEITSPNLMLNVGIHAVGEKEPLGEYAYPLT